MIMWCYHNSSELPAYLKTMLMREREREGKTHLSDLYNKQLNVVF